MSTNPATAELSSAPAKHSSDAPTLCGACHTSAARYTCPGCAARTCSAGCVRAHKATTGCSGARDRAAYVPLRAYGYGALMNDYVFLEDVGRVVADVGREIVRARIAPTPTAAVPTVARGMARGRGGRAGQNVPGGKAVARREMLRRQLELWDIELELLPYEMAKAKLNRSTWDYKNKRPLFTIEFRLHPPPIPPALRGTLAPEQPVTLLAHHATLGDTLGAVLRREVDRASASGGKGKERGGLAEWARALVVPAPEDPEGFEPPEYVMRAADALPALALAPSSSSKRPSATTTPTAERAYATLDAAQTLSTLLRGTRFVEFPTVEVWPRGAFVGTLVGADGVHARVGPAERGGSPARKRRRVDVQAGRRVLGGLVGGYGSSSEEEGEEGVLARLGSYAGSDDEADDRGDPEASADVPVAAGSSDEEEEENEGVDYRALLDSLPLAEPLGDFLGYSGESGEDEDER